MAETRSSRSMPFGKHKGVPLADLPDDYLDWLLNLDDLREPLRRALEAEDDRRTTARQQTRPPHAHAHRLPNRAVCDALILAGFRALTKQHHPDAGGDHAAMVAVNAAAEWLRHQVRGLAA